MNWLMRFTYWYNRMMAGRYGSDQLSIGLMAAYLLLIFIANLLRLPLLSYLALALLVWGLYRIFSRNISKRYRKKPCSCGSGTGFFSGSGPAPPDLKAGEAKP